MPLPVVSYPWFALTVKHHHEKIVERALAGKGITPFLPLYESRHRSGGRIKKVLLPLFPSYVFAAFDPLHRLPVLTIPGVSSVVSFAKEPTPVPPEDLERIQTMIDSGLKMEPHPYLHSGDLVYIGRGPLSGLQGVLVGVKPGLRLVVSIPLLQRSVSAEIDQEWARPVVPLPKSA